MTKIKNLIEPKFTLGELGVELMFPELVKNQTQVLGMIFLVLRENQNVVEIDQNEVIGVGVEDEFIMREKVGGALTRPKDMTVYSYEP